MTAPTADLDVLGPVEFAVVEFAGGVLTDAEFESQKAAIPAR